MKRVSSITTAIRIIGACTMVALLTTGCARTTTRKATVETPNKTYEIKVEKTEK